MANSINDLSPSIRDFLLTKNLVLSDTVTNNGLSGVGLGLGIPSNVTSNITSVQASENLEDTGTEIRDALISRNRYTSIDDMISACIIDNNFNYGQQDGGYIDENNELNVGGPSTDPYNTIGSLLTQEGFGLSSSGFVNQSDIRSSLAGRILGATGAINETPLGIIGGQQLLLALGQKDVFNAQKELFGKVNLQPFSLLRGADFIVPNYDITVSSTSGGRVFDTLLDLSGFEIPRSVIDEGGSIFNDGDVIIRNNALLKNTGKGQLMRLFENLNANQYKPAYDADGLGRSKVGVIDPVEYGPVTSGLTLVELERSPVGGLPLLNVDGFEGTDKIWDPNVAFPTNNTLLSKTKQLFNDGIMYNIMFDEQGTPSIDFSQLNTPSGGRLSKGSGVLSEDFLKGTEKDNVFSRTWSSTKTYGAVKDLQKNSGLYDYNNKIRNDIEDSVLGDNGFVKISPYRIPDGEKDVYEAKKFMFSLENLAWNDNLTNLPKFEIGNGDLETETKGRIMWFPPYDIKFTDTTAVNWDSTKFIGRGEPVYTYNNTERSGTLTFKIIIDYPDYMNDSKITTNEIMASLAAGSTDYNTFLSVDEGTKLTEEYNNNIEPKNVIPLSTPNAPDRVVFYFENDLITINPSYEATGLNSTWVAAGFATDLSAKLRQNKGFKIRVDGFASLSGEPDANLVLSDGRIESVKDWLIANLDADINVSSRLIKSKSYGETLSEAVGTNDSEAVKRERAAKVDFIYLPKDDEQVTNVTDIEKEKTSTARETATNIKKRFHREDEYFEKLKNSDVESDKIIYDNIREKIKFFHPAFHSTTPEGFNSRLTFLQQCTRQGPTDKTNKSKNLAFGSPPICILRIGDFYNTKIAINTLAITYDPLVWDLNPEGVGVQPMIANVDISFKFIGGSGLSGPINKLQNAVSFNYFANSSVYDPRADRWVRPDKTDPKKDTAEFEFLEGETNLRDYVEDAYNPIVKTESVSGIPNEQDATGEAAAEKQSENTGTTVTDNSILENMGWSVKFNETVSANTFSFIYTSGIGFDLTNLSQQYNIRLKIQLIDGSFKDVLVGKVGSADTGSINSSTLWNQTDYGTGVQQFNLIFNGGNINQLIEREKLDVEY